MPLNKLFSSAIAATAILSASVASAQTWTVDASQSTLGFEVAQGGSPLVGTFQTWTASIEFDPAAPENAKISATIETGSALTGNPQFDGTLPSADWFDVSAFPAAEFTADGASLVKGNTYRAEGTLAIKGTSQPVTLEFTLDIEGDTAKARGKATVDRLAYQLGAGVATDTVGDVVTVTLDLTASR